MFFSAFISSLTSLDPVSKREREEEMEGGREGGEGGRDLNSLLLFCSFIEISFLSS